MKVFTKSADRLTATDVRRWNGLQAGDRTFQSPFLCPQFTQLMGRVRPDIEVGVIEHDGEVTGFFPFQRGRWGVGRPVASGYNDHHGAVIEKGRPWDVRSLLQGCGLNLWHFDHLSAGQQQFARWHRERTISPVIDVSGGVPDYSQRGTSRELGAVDRKARKLEREYGTLRFELRVDNPAALQTLLEWKRDQYARTGVGDVLAPIWIRRALAQAQHFHEPAFAGILSALYSEDRMIAAHLGLLSHGVWHWWFPAYDRCFSRYSPGLILLLRMMRSAPSIGVHTIDLGKGDARYKRTLMTGGIPLAAGTARAPSLTAGILTAQQRIQSAGRSVRYRLNAIKKGSA